ncbi:MAG: futalosine hydrolase [Saprospiraceae bacterium]
MKILVVVATQAEIAPLLTRLAPFRRGDVFVWGGLHVRVLVAGVGLMATAWNLGRVLSDEAPDFALQAGVGGAIDRSLSLGEVVYVVSEAVADLGAETAEGDLLDLFALGLTDPDGPPFRAGLLHAPPASFLRAVSGVSVNAVHGSAASIERLRRRYPHAQVESMEGAAFFYACLNAGLPFAQIRAISNYVEPRNRDAWNLSLAIANLNETLWDMLSLLSEEP